MCEQNTTDGIHCPECGHDIGMWGVVAAPLPNLIQCPHCRMWLEYHNWLNMVPIIIGLIAEILAISLGIAVTISPTDMDFAVLVFSLSALSLSAICELVTSVYMRRHYRLQKRDGIVVEDWF